MWGNRSLRRFLQSDSESESSEDEQTPPAAAPRNQENLDDVFQRLIDRVNDDDPPVPQVGVEELRRQLVPDRTARCMNIIQFYNRFLTPLSLVDVLNDSEIAYESIINIAKSDVRENLVIAEDQEALEEIARNLVIDYGNMRRELWYDYEVADRLWNELRVLRDRYNNGENNICEALEEKNTEIIDQIVAIVRLKFNMQLNVIKFNLLRDRNRNLTAGPVQHREPVINRETIYNMQQFREYDPPVVAHSRSNTRLTYVGDIMSAASAAEEGRPVLAVAQAPAAAQAFVPIRPRVFIPPLERVQERARPVERAPEPQLPIAGDAFQVHNVFKYIDLETALDEMERLGLDRRVVCRPREDMGVCFNAWITEKINTLFEGEERNAKLNAWRRLASNMDETRIYFDESFPLAYERFPDLVSRTITGREIAERVMQYINNRPPEYQKSYISTFLESSCTAYSPDRMNTATCGQGLFERIILVIRFLNLDPSYDKLTQALQDFPGTIAAINSTCYSNNEQRMKDETANMADATEDQRRNKREEIYRNCVVQQFQEGFPLVRMTPQLQNLFSALLLSTRNGGVFDDYMFMDTNGGRSKRRRKSAKRQKVKITRRRQVKRRRCSRKQKGLKRKTKCRYAHPPYLTKAIRVSAF
jgi:hypothetical protein